MRYGGVVMYYGVEEERLLRRELGGGMFESRPLYGKTLALVKGPIGGSYPEMAHT